MSEYDLLKKLDYYQTFLYEFSEKGTNGGLYDLIIYNYLINLEENVMGILTDNREEIKNNIKNIKNNLQPHFIFNALNSIRALVDENPARARQSITQLSNILRSSILVDKIETVPLKKEIDIDEKT